MRNVLDRAIPTDKMSSEQGSSERDLQIYRRKFDDLKAKTRQKGEQLVQMEEKLKEVEASQSTPKSSSSSSKNGEKDLQARQLRILENKLDKAILKYNEATSITKTYDVIVSKLKEE